MRDTIIYKISNISAKQFANILSNEEKVFLSSLSVTPEKTRVKTLGKQVACLVLNTNDKKCTICNKSVPYIDFKNYIQRQYCDASCKQLDIKNINTNANKALRGNKNVVKKRENTLKNRYGVSNIMLNTSVKEKRQKNCMDKYGVSHISKREDVKVKRRQTNISKYGVGNYLVKYVKDLQNHPKLAINYHKLLTLNNIIPLFSEEEYYGIIKDNKIVYYNFKCKKCDNIFSKNICSWNDLERCHVCDKTTNTYECYIENLLQKYNINYEKHNRTILDGLELDFYLPNLKIGIEVDGLYYHSNKFLNNNYHLNKTNACEKLGINLIHIFGDEFYNKIALDNRLRSILKSNKIIIGARKCIVKQIDNHIKAKFVSKYHLQGDINSKFNYGLFYRNKLVSVMSFGSYRKCTGANKIENEYELYRYCTMRGITILGGANKLFKAFIKYIKPKKIITFADRRYSNVNNNIYSKIGMTFIKYSTPNYWIVIGNKRYHRFGYRKNILSKKLQLFDTKLSERENLTNNNISVIYDCGNIKYEYIS